MEMEMEMKTKMGIENEIPTARNPSSYSTTSPCANYKAAYYNCFNKWYLEKFLKGQWDKQGCLSEWDKYKNCLSQHLDDKHLLRFLDADAIRDLSSEC